MTTLLCALVLVPPVATARAADDSIEALREALDAASGRERVALLNRLAKAYWGVSTEDVLATANEALVLARRLGDDAGEAEALRNLGIGHWYGDDYANALARCLEALAVYERVGDSNGVAATRSTIGTIYLNLERFEEALSNYGEALEIAERTGDENRMGIVLSNLGTTSLGLEQPEEALGYFQRALAILEDSGSALSVLTCLGNIGGAYHRLGRHEEALAVNLRILEMAREIDSKVRLVDALTDAGRAHVELGAPAAALPYLEEAQELAEREGLGRSLQDVLAQLVRVHETMGDLALALGYQRQSTELAKRIFDEEHAAAIADLEVRYETEKKEREIEVQRLEIDRQRAQRAALVGISLLVAALAVASHGRYRAKKQANALLERLSTTDPLTGLSNRRRIMEAMDKERDRARRGGAPFSLILVDIDHFKRINDGWGHEAGDRVLCAVADALRRAVRPMDEVARWGGEEFLVLLPECERDEALGVASRLHDGVRSAAQVHGGETLTVTATSGVSTHHAGDSLQDVLRRADDALYGGKGLGRDRVVPES